MGNLITTKSAVHKTQPDHQAPSALSQVTLHFEYNKTISEARAEVRAKSAKA